MNNILLSLKNLSVSVGEKNILNDLSYDFERGKIYAIMGPNGSGKSTLAYSIVGHPSYLISKTSKISIGQEEIMELEVHKRAEKGIFLSFQSPLALAGVKVHQMLQIALQGKKDPLQIHNEIKRYSKELHIKEELLRRSLNEGLSGGERKKMELLQAAVLDKDLLILDEVDTGVDIDSLKVIAQFLDKNKKDKTYIIITHYNRILKYLKPDKVLVLVKGQLQRVGDYTLADEIEKNGYK